MKQLKPFYYYLRNGIFYFVPLDAARNKLTAISTGTRDKNSAFEKMWKMYFERQKNFENTHKPLVYDEQVISSIIKSVLHDELSKLHFNDFYAREGSQDNTAIVSSPPVVKNALGKYADYTYRDFLKKFWDYKTSPYVNYQRKCGKTVHPESFKKSVYVLAAFDKFIPDVKLQDLTADAVSECLLRYQNERDISDASMYRYSTIFKQPLHFLYQLGYLNMNIADKVIRFSKKHQEKEIFTVEEVKKIFYDKTNFTSEQMYLINKLLFLTGCRIGEILALQLNDIKQTNGFCYVHISKNWVPTTKRVKTTKTERVDDVMLPHDFADQLLDYIRYKRKNKSSRFIFTNKNNVNEPVSYFCVLNNFHATMKKLNIERDGLTLHSYRHTYATILRDAGFTSEELLHLTRHKSRQCLDIYINHETDKSIAKQDKALHYITAVLSG